MVEGAIAQDVAARFDHVMVDEYQDTNKLQASILLALSYQTLLADRVESSMTAGGGPTAIAFPLLVVLLILAGLGIGALGSGLNMRRFLQV